MEDKGDGDKVSGEVRGDFVVKADVGERMGKRRKELGDRAIGSEIGRRCARLKRDKVNVVEVKNKQDIFVPKVRGDGKTSCEVRDGPLAMMNGAGA